MAMILKMKEEKLGLRQRNKLEKLQRIKIAARELFNKKGFDQATTREIAEQAQVGLGTLFTYAENKRDLLFIIFNEPLLQLDQEAFHDVPSELPFLEQLIIVFRHFYRFFSKQPELSRYLLRELTFYQAGTVAEQFQKIRLHTIDCIGQLVERAKANGQVTSSEENTAVAQVIFILYAGEVRNWLMGVEQNVEAGLMELRRSLQLLIQGIQPPLPSAK